MIFDERLMLVVRERLTGRRVHVFPELINSYLTVNGFNDISSFKKRLIV